MTWTETQAERREQRRINELAALVEAEWAASADPWPMRRIRRELLPLLDYQLHDVVEGDHHPLRRLEARNLLMEREAERRF